MAVERYTLARILSDFSCGLLDEADRSALADALVEEGRDTEAEIVRRNPHRSRVRHYTDYDRGVSAIEYLEQKPSWMAWDQWDPSAERPAAVTEDVFDLFAEPETDR